MPRIVTLSRSAIYIYAGDHGLPHFHVLGPDISVKVDIRTLQVIEGTYARRSLAEAIEWAASNEDLLQAKWREYNARD